MRQIFISQKEINFIGKDALLKQREQGVQRKYVQLLLNDHDLEFDTWCWGGEPIYRNGKYCGMTTTTGYGFTFKKQVKIVFLYLSRKKERRMLNYSCFLAKMKKNRNV